MRRKRNQRMDIATICMEALVAVIGAMGALALVAFITGSHMTDWNGIVTGMAFVVLALGIWIIMEISNRKGQMYA